MKRREADQSNLDAKSRDQSLKPKQSLIDQADKEEAKLVRDEQSDLVSAKNVDQSSIQSISKVNKHSVRQKDVTTKHANSSNGMQLIEEEKVAPPIVPMKPKQAKERLA